MNATGAMTSKKEEKENKGRRSRCKQWPVYIALVSIVTEGCHIASIDNGFDELYLENSQNSAKRMLRFPRTHICYYQCTRMSNLVREKGKVTFLSTNNLCYEANVHLFKNVTV